MLFSSFAFILLFLPLLLVCWWCVGSLCAQYLPRLLLAFSLFFAVLWYEDFATLALMGGLFFTNYTLARFLRGSEVLDALMPLPLSRKGVLVLGLFFNALCFCVAVGQPFVHSLLGTAVSALPTGMPFFLLVHVAFLVTVYKNDDVPVENIMPVALFSSFFPTFLGGPIVRYEHMAPQMQNLSPLHAFTVSRGLTRFVLGLGKAVFIAGTLAPLADFSAAHLSQNPMQMWLAALAFTLHIYFAFSAYTDMALGLALMLGIWLPENFASPYKAQNIIEFWRRWHITLSSWMRDFLYVPLKGKCSPYISVLGTMLLCGLWSGMAHGAHAGHGIGAQAMLAFAVWGLVHGAMLALNHAYRSLLQRFCPLHRRERLQKSLCLRALSTALTFVCVVLAWVIFASKDMGLAVQSYALMGKVFLPSWWQGGSFGALATQDVYVVLGGCFVVWCCPSSYDILNGTRILGIDTQWRPSIAWALGVAVVFVCALLLQGTPISLF